MFRYFRKKKVQKKKQIEQVLNFTDLMISVDECKTTEELQEVLDYAMKYKYYYKQHERSFAKEHIGNKIHELHFELTGEVLKYR